MAMHVAGLQLGWCHGRLYAQGTALQTRTPTWRPGAPPPWAAAATSLDRSTCTLCMSTPSLTRQVLHMPAFLLHPCCVACSDQAGMVPTCFRVRHKGQGRHLACVACTLLAMGVRWGAVGRARSMCRGA